jgi:hypothetical protein
LRRLGFAAVFVLAASGASAGQEISTGQRNLACGSSSLIGDGRPKWIATMSLGCQRIFIAPDRDLAVMTASGLYFQGQGDGRST